MPIYEYECENRHRFEKWQSVRDEPVKTCPECGQPVHKVYHPAGIIFKGSGWYVTDHRKGGGKAESSGETKPSGKSESSSAGDSKSDKPAAEKKD